MHHGDQPINDEMREMFENVIRTSEQQSIVKEFAKEMQLGPTGKFPEGKIVEHDEGEIKIAITTYQNKVVVNFGKPVAFIAFTAEQAEEIAALLSQRAIDLANRQSG